MKKSFLKKNQPFKTAPSNIYFYNFSATTDSNRSKRSSSYNGGDGIISIKSTTPSRRSSSVISSPAPVASTPLTNSVSNLISNYSPPVYAVNVKLPKNSNSSEIIDADPSTLVQPITIATDPMPKGSASTYSSLLCYQSANPPSPPSSLCSPKHAQKIITSSLAVEKLGADTTDTVVVKKRTKLRHRFSDVGSWGRKRKERNPKYHSMHIESLEVLGEPVVEDEFFVSYDSIIEIFLFNQITSELRYKK